MENHWKTQSIYKRWKNLASAMKESGKFTNLEINKIKNVQEVGYKNYESLAKNEKGMLRYYTCGDGMYINHVLRGIQEEYPEDRRMINDIENAFKNKTLEENITVYRGLNDRFCDIYKITDDDIDNAIYNNDKSAIVTKLGNGIIEKGMMSTSIDYGEAKNMTYGIKRIIMELETNKNNNAIYLGKNSNVSDQEEVLFAPGHKIVYTDIEVKAKEYADKYTGEILISKEIIVRGRIENGN